jgi:hypothetical protein
MANRSFSGNLDKMARRHAPPERVYRCPQSKTGHPSGRPVRAFGSTTDQQTERMVALRELRIATIAISKLLKFMC